MDSHCLELVVVVAVEAEEPVGMRGSLRIEAGGVGEVDGDAVPGERSRIFGRPATLLVFERCRGEHLGPDADVVAVLRSQVVIEGAELA